MIHSIAIVGLGLIGGSFAKAIKAHTSCHITGYDNDTAVLQQALSEGSIGAVGALDAPISADLVLVALYPRGIVEFCRSAIPAMRPGTLLIDLCGIKSYICNEITPPAIAHGIRYIGGHPMAGRECSGYCASLPTLFEGGSMILVPTEATDFTLPEGITSFFERLGFSRVVTTTPAHHDAMIAFTSQLAHVVSSAYIKSPEALQHGGYSAGSYKDLTRVAKLNEVMWTDLFLKNSGPLLAEIDEIIKHLQEYRNAIAAGDAPALQALLKDGRERKEQIG